MKVKLVRFWQQKALSAKAISISRFCKLVDLQASTYYAIDKRASLPQKINPTQIALKATFMASGQPTVAVV